MMKKFVIVCEKVHYTPYVRIVEAETLDAALTEAQCDLNSCDELSSEWKCADDSGTTEYELRPDSSSEEL